MFSDMLTWALGQVGQVITYCWLWFERLSFELGFGVLLVGVFACGLLAHTFLKPLFGRAGVGLGADYVRAWREEDSDDE